ncbi:MAG TPA: HAMP domain-containing sensor histidine kinase [Candidatus Acidoferrales bacterium]|jgi:signal transduction histidine kinase|nr:HAMP domain-containing sensor histidine kinase [Candidatus Acidoferrales bacterium]
MSKKWRLTDRTRTLLTLELAIVLPAAALMGFSIWNLKHIQRDKAIEAAIQRDFSYVLKIAEKKSWEKANDLVTAVRKEFPDIDDGFKIKVRLERMLLEHPEYSYAAFYDKKNNLLVSRVQPGHDQDTVFCGHAQEDINAMATWLPLESTGLTKSLRMMEEKGEPPVGFYGGWTVRDNQHVYWNVAYFIPPGIAKDRVTLGVVAFDEDYLRKTFLPAMMKDVLSSKSSVLRADANPPVMMIHPSKDYAPWVASANWDGGKPEAERKLEYVFPDLTLAIKYQGTTVADIGTRFLRYNYIVLAALSMVMIGGVWLTYRNVSREMTLSRLKSDFVANVSHELRTPLALIRLYAETLELGRLTAKEKYHEYFRIIREESERLTALINNILDFSRIEAGRKEYEFQETNLAELVHSTLDSYRFQIQQNGFAFEENISSDIPPVIVDREAIARSLLNLVNNALKYSKEQKYIGVSLYRSNSSVNLEVRDRGIGISANEQEKIFEKFYRCGDPLVHNVKGSGLGLSLVRHIARAHGGDVLVESAPEKGSKFTIALPLAPPPQTGTAVA